MLHFMNLHPQPFALIENGTKTIELRLYDEKRRTIKIGDTIVFTNSAKPNLKLHTIVKNLHVFHTFEELYHALPLDKCGYLSDELPSATPKDMEAYYSIEKQKEHGVLGIEIELVCNG